MGPQPTGPALAVFDGAKEHVVKRGHDSVHGGHILLGVLGLQHGIASATLNSIGVDRIAVRAALDAILPPSQERGRDGEYPYDPSGVAVLKSAMAAAAKKSSERLTSALILVGILDAGGPELRAFREAGVRIPELAAELQSRVDDPE
jgi:ATP-dependent Clp protease ATP-binding subunit ClpA